MSRHKDKPAVEEQKIAQINFITKLDGDNVAAASHPLTGRERAAESYGATLATWPIQSAARAGKWFSLFALLFPRHSLIRLINVFINA